MTITYQWQRSVPGSGVWTDIPGATGIAYNVEDTDAAYLLRIVETDTNIVNQDSTPSGGTAPSAQEEQFGTGQSDFTGGGGSVCTYTRTGRGIMARSVRGPKFPRSKTGRGIMGRQGSGFTAHSDLLYLWDSLGNLHMKPGRNITDDLT